MASPPSTEATLHPGFRASGERPRRAIFRRGMVSSSFLLVCAATEAYGPLGRHQLRAAAVSPSHPDKAVKRKRSAGPKQLPLEFLGIVTRHVQKGKIGRASCRERRKDEGDGEQ